MGNNNNDSDQESASEKEFNEKIYLQKRKILIEGERESAKAFDKAILTLSASAFWISIILIGNFVQEFKKETLCFLIISWILFLLSISSTILAILMSQNAHIKEINLLDKEYVNNNSQEENNIYSKITGILNITSVITFILGALFLVLFSTLSMYC